MLENVQIRVFEYSTQMVHMGICKFLDVSSENCVVSVDVCNECVPYVKYGALQSDSS